MFLDPGKLLVIAVVALVVLGPDQLPKVAKSAGSLWHDFTRWRASIDQQVRGAFPDLPPTHEIVAAVRSPMALLDRLAQESVKPSPTAPSPAAPSPAAPTAAGVGTGAGALPVSPGADPWDAWPSSARHPSSAPDDEATVAAGGVLVSTDVSMN